MYLYEGETIRNSVKTTYIDDFLQWTKNHNTTVPFHWQPKLVNIR